MSSANDIGINEYVKLAQRTSNVTDIGEKFVHGAMGLGGESGEVIDIIKKWKFHKHPLDIETLDHLEKELGDVAWYFGEMCVALCRERMKLDGTVVTPADVLKANIEKLQKRYPEGFSTEKSMNRAEDDV